MGSRSSTGGAILHGVLISLQVGNEFGERICWKILRGNDRTRCLDDEPECREIGNRVVGRLLVERLTPGMSAAVAVELHSLPASHGWIAGYRIGEDQSGGTATRAGPQGRGERLSL